VETDRSFALDSGSGEYMKFVLLALFVSSQAFAAGDIKKFTCSLSKLPNESITFTLKKFGTSNVDLMFTDNVAGPFSTRSKNKLVQRIVDTLNGQGGVLRKKTFGLQLFGDQIGCDFVYLNLDKKTDYRTGNIKVDFQCSDSKPMNDKVKCF
jgi:hypothetical protein